MGRSTAAFLTALLSFAASSAAYSQSPKEVLLRESFSPAKQVHVNSQSNITGWLALPPDKGQSSGRKLDVVGKSKIVYDERILEIKGQQVDRTIRFYSRMDFERVVGSEQQQSGLRSEARRLVILRHKQYEVPFAPTVPLTWNEIDLVRTDVFTPALNGLLPTAAVRPGDSWAADLAAVQELTDLESIQQGSLTCSFKQLTTLANRPVAQIAFKGTVTGVGEDGPARHLIEGSLYFDLKTNHLSYLTMQGTHVMLDKTGQESGVIKGTFVLTREPESVTNELKDAALQGLVLEPNEENTLLLCDLPELGVRFLYPRRWHIAGVNGRQIGLDEKRGSGLLITVEPLANVPGVAQFQKESRDVLIGKEKAIVHRMDPPRLLMPGLETFSVDADVGKQRVTLQYYLIRKEAGGAVITARLLPNDLATMQRDVERIARSFQVAKGK